MSEHHDQPDEHVLVPFEPDLPLHTNGNGSKTRRRTSPFPAITFGVLLGALTAGGVVTRVQWLNLARVSSWGRPAAAAAVAGAMTAAFRRGGRRASVLGGAIAGLATVWGVYAIVRSSVDVLFVGRSFARTVAGDLARLFLEGAGGGAAGAAATMGVHGSVIRARARRART